MTIAQPAPRPTTREERGLELYRTRGHEIRHASPGDDLYLVPSEASTGRGFYSVDYREETCDCPDFLYTGENCKHILALAIAIAKGVIRHPELAAGDPFVAAGVRKIDLPAQVSPETEIHACLSGIVYLGVMVENEDGDEVEIITWVPCKKCSEAGEG